MASLMQQGNRFYCQFIYLGKHHCFSLGKVPRDEAEAKINQADYLLMRLKQGLLQIPPGMDIIAFLEFDGKPPVEPVPSPGTPTLKLLRDEYLNVHRGSLEANTIIGMELHKRYLHLIPSNEQTAIQSVFG